MGLHVDNVKFETAHRLFLRHMFDKSGGVLFTGFGHDAFVNDEVSYKWTVYHRGRTALSLRKWEHWRSKTGKILQACKAACHPSVSANLLEHKYGSSRYSEAALYKVSRPEEIQGLEAEVFKFFLGGPGTQDQFGPRFDLFAEYLRENHLSCKWAFLAYLAFLLSSQHYFPILPTRFENLLGFYGIKKPIAGHVSWERYSVLLDLADALRSRLAIYGHADAIQVQSYMWVVSNLVGDRKRKPRRVPDIGRLDFDTELQARTERAKERERIGLAGERLVFEQEQERLEVAGRNDLANKVCMVSVNDLDRGYDILSYTSGGDELHIEVKTTTCSPTEDHGFWLSETERLRAEKDKSWVVYRVWGIDSTAAYDNLGNVVLDAGAGWELNPSSWYVKQKRSLGDGA